MARKADPKTADAKRDADETPGDVEAGATPAEAAADSAENTVEPVPEPADEAPVVAQEPGRAEAFDAPAPEVVASPEPELVADPITQPDSGMSDRVEPPTAPMAAAPRRSVWPMLSAGVLTAALGLAAGWWLFHDGGPLGGTRLATAEGRIAELETRLKAAEAAQADLSAAQDGLAGAEALGALDARVKTAETAQAGTAEGLAALEKKLDEALQRPPEADAAATAAYERELAAMREMFARELEAIRADAEKASAAQQAAAVAEADAALVAALASVEAALDAGGAFGDELDSIAATNPDLPVAPLRAFAEGVPTLAELRASFPDAARAANEAALAGDNGGGVGGFLKAQLGMRSLAPQDGDSADAVLSRAEAALAEGDLPGAVAGLDALPEPAARAMADWRAAAERRLAALSAFDALSQKVRS